MRESLCDSSLVNEKPARRQHSRDLAQRYPRPLCASAHMVARSEIENEVERSALERQVSDVCLKDGSIDSRGPDSLVRQCYQTSIDVDSDKFLRTKSRREHGQSNPAAAADFKYARSRKKPKRADEQRDFDR